ncbi:MAG: hypothetical protein KatS3mg004_3132 [Bryobacteraceae bacterium]|nr:MAG: hypothetical protein KatS3mg004_3132 [Bryobacteraceae bacterium]
MRFSRLVALAFLTGLAVTASPLLPESALGVGKTVQITNDRLLLVLSGGRYNGLVDGIDADLWCVDVERFASKGNTYLANVVPLLDWTPEQAALVRKGRLDNDGFYWSDLGLGAVERYQAAAWLITQMDAYRYGTHVYDDLHIQQAVWAILDEGWFMSIYITDEAHQWMRTAADFIREHPDYGLGQWAVVSGSVLPDGTFAGWQYQTFLTPLAASAPAFNPPGNERLPLADAPEPGTFILAGAGLLVLAAVLRRRG